MLPCLSLPRTTLREGERFLDRYAVEARPAIGQSPTRERRLSRMRTLLRLLEKPQNTYKVIHVAGTTGKGSTCLFLEAILRAQGFKTGLCVSPHAIDVRERFQLNGALISEERFLCLLNRVVAATEVFFAQEQDWPSYCECLRAMTFLLFAEEQVDYAVVETGIGGLFDSSNVVERTDKFCVITKLGYDHVKTLGATIEEIARQKMGIVHAGNEVVIATQEEISQTRLVQMAESAAASHVWCVPEERSGAFEFSAIPYLQQNAETAFLACQRLADRDAWKWNPETALRAVRAATVPLRFERYDWKGKTLILDVAHNPQKMQGLVQALHVSFPTELLACAVAFNPGTDIPKTLAPLYPIASRVACVDFVGGQGDYRFRFVDPVSVAAMVHEDYPEKETLVLPEWEVFLKWIEDAPEDVIVITGSFHFVASVHAKLIEEANRE